MDGIVYHASKTKGLTELDPSKSKHEHNHGKKFLYATTSKELAMIMSMRTTDLYTVVGGKGTQEDPVVFVERLPGVFDKFLHNSTNIYEISGKDFYQGTSYEGEVVTEKKQQVLTEEYIEDVYSKIKEMEQTGRVQMYHYPDRPADIPLDNSDLIESRMLPSYRTAQSSKERLGIVKKMLEAHPKLFPKIIKSIVSENLNTIRNKIHTQNKKRALPLANKKNPEQITDNTQKKKDPLGIKIENWGIEPEPFRKKSQQIALDSLKRPRKGKDLIQLDDPTEQKLPGDMNRRTHI